MPNLQRRPLLGSALAAALLGAITLLPGWAPAASLPPYSLRTLPAAWEYVTAIDDQRNILGSLTIDGRSTTVVLRPDGTHWRPEEGLVSNPPEVVISVHSMNRHGQILLVYPFAVGPLRDSYNLNLEWGPFNRSPDGANVVVRLVVRDEKGARALPDFPVRLDSCRSVRGNINNAGTVAVNYEFWTGQFLDWEGWLQEDIRAKSMFYRPGQGWQHFATPPGLPQSVLHYLREDGTAVGVAFSLDIVIGNDGGQFLATTYAPCLFHPGKPATVLTPLRGKVYNLNPRGDAVMAVPGDQGAFAIANPGELAFVRRGEGPRALGRLQRDDGVNPVQRAGDCIQWHLSDDGTLTYKVATEIAPSSPGDPRRSIYVKCDVHVTAPGQPDVVLHEQEASAFIGRFVPGDGLWVAYDGSPMNTVTYQGELHPCAELVPGNAAWLDFLAAAGEQAPLEQINWRPGDFTLNYFNAPFRPMWASFSPPEGGPRINLLLEPSRAVVRHLEAAQVVQDWNQSIPLVAGKRTFVRAHVEAMQSAAAGKPAKGKLRGFSNGVELPGSPLATLNPRGQGVVARDVTATREQPGVALDFVLPLSWCANTLELVVESAEGHFANHVETLTFTVVPPLRIEFFPLTLLSDDAPPAPTSDAEVILMQDRILGMMPVASLRSGNFRPLDIRADQLSSNRDLGRVNSRLREALALDADGRGLAASLSVRERARQLGYYLAVTDLAGDLGGLADGIGAGLPPRVDPGAAATITGQAQSPNRAGHELAHLLGQYHATTSERTETRDGKSSKLGYCDELAPLMVPDVVPDFPHFGRVPGQAHNVPLMGPLNGPERILGVREGPTGRPEFLSTQRHFELMGYCDQPNRWISGYTYANCLQAILEFFAPPSAPSLARSPAFAAAGRAPDAALMLARGSVNLDTGAVQLEPSLPFGAGPAPAPAESGGLLLRFVDAAGLVLQDWPFDVGTPVEQERVKHFSLIVARPADAVQLQVLRAGELAASLAASAHAPNVQLLTPNGGPVPAGNTIHVAWQAGDLDGDPLRFALRYSPDDGATWRTLASDTEASSLEIAASSLTGSAIARFQVVATDGLNFAADMSDAVVQVAEPPPSVVILTPKPGHRFHISETIMLRASGHSASAGFDNFQEAGWASDRAGKLGDGLQLQAPAASLAPGLHQLTVTVRDATGQTATSAVAIQVDEFAAAEMLAPEIDGETGVLSLPVLIEPGATATLEGSANLLDWTVITNQMAVGDRVDFQRPLESGQRFYRVSASGAAPVITEGLMDIELTGQPAVTLEAFVEGAPPVSYHWLHNGLPVANASPLSSLVLLNPGFTDLGTYALVASNRFGRAQSQVFSVTATGDAPAFTLQPQNVCLSRFLETVRFRVEVTGTPAPSFQWYFNGTPLAGENQSELIVDPDPSGLGEYHVVAANALGVATSEAGRFLICPPEINWQPEDLCIKAGASDSVFVGVESYQAPAYQWYFNSSPLASATNFALAFQPFQAANAGAYFVTVAGLGITQTSRVAQVTLCP